MAILNYTTKIDSFKTIGEIQKILVSHGAKKITMDYDEDNLPAYLTFGIPVREKIIYYNMPANWKGVLNAFEKNKIPTTYRNKEQALRTAWRILKDWIEAQMAIIEAQLAEFAEVFLPYAITEKGLTLWEEIKQSNSFKLLK